MQPTFHPIARARKQPPQNRTAPTAPQAKADTPSRQSGNERTQEALGGRRANSRLSWPTACIGLLGLAVSYLAVRMVATPQQPHLMADPSPFDTGSDHPQAAYRRLGAETDAAWTSEPASRSLTEREASTVTPTQADRGPQTAAPDTLLGELASGPPGSMSASQRRRVAEAISREPIGLDASPFDEALLDAHALPVARALRTLIVDTADDRADSTPAQRRASEETSLSEISDLILHTQYSDPRWKYLIATNLRYAYQGEGSGIHLEPARWDEVIMDRYFAQVEWIPDVTPDGRPGHKMATLDHWAYHCFHAKGQKPPLGPEALQLAKERQSQARAPHQAAGCDAPNVKRTIVGEAGIKQDRPSD